MKLIINSNGPRKIGQVVHLSYDYNNKPISQPAMIVKEATKDEYIKSYIENSGNQPGDYRLLEGYYFYEVTTD